MGKILRELIKDLKEKDIKDRQDIDPVRCGLSNGVEVRGITCDSRKVEEGFLFVCITGFNFDGHAFIPEAIKKGACALVVEKNIEPHEGVTVIKVPNTRYALGILANKFYDYPSSKLRVIGITGTNGKTTTTYLVRQILREAGKKTALFGTIAYQLGDRTLPASCTTPQSLELQSMFKKLIEENFDCVVMEVSSHALALDRVAGCEFDVGVFTNLSRDHLDFHKTMENYLEAKTKLFRLLSPTSQKYNHLSADKAGKRAIINIDDPYAKHIIKNTKVEILTYGIEQEADVRAYDIEISREGLKFYVTTPQGKTTIFLQLLGKHNIYNALAAICVGLSEGVSLNEIREAISKLENVPGRFERIDCGQPFNVVVDYAHTDGALKEILKAVRRLTQRRVILVFGCGGERDRGKRPLMGEVAATNSDIIILTSDNPRGEEPMKIIKEIEAGINPALSYCEVSRPIRKGRGCDYLIIENRFEAIKKALSLAGEGDLVLIAGKGHEDYQIIEDKRLPFDDKNVVWEILGKMTYKQALAYLYDLERFGIKLGLKRMKRLLELLGNPDHGLKAIHIAGTNGKGSTTVFISSILKEAGFKVGTYTSPHLTDFRERIAIDGVLIPQEKVVQLLADVKPQIKKISADSEFGHPTFFEVVTAMAFTYFFEEKVDFAVLEVGLGGRLDATNVVEPLVSVITNSDYDHMDRLGSEITSIASEHAGIIKKESLVITAAQGEALTVIKKACQRQKARLYQVGKDIRYESLESDWEGQSFNVRGIFSEFDNLKISLLGRHQLINACCAIGAVKLLTFHNTQISEESIRRGLEKTCWPGRLEIVRQTPLIVLDGAHNHPAAKQLKETLLEYLKKKERLILVIGILKDKEIEKIVKELVPLAFKVLVTAPKTSRAASPEDIYKAAVKYNRNVTIAAEVEAAVRQALTGAEKDDIICVTGSLCTVREAREFLMEAKKQCPEAIELKGA